MSRNVCNQVCPLIPGCCTEMYAHVNPFANGKWLYCSNWTYMILTLKCGVWLYYSKTAIKTFSDERGLTTLDPLSIIELLLDIFNNTKSFLVIIPVSIRYLVSYLPYLLNEYLLVSVWK